MMAGSTTASFGHAIAPHGQFSPPVTLMDEKKRAQGPSELFRQKKKYAIPHEMHQQIPASISPAAAPVQRQQQPDDSGLPHQLKTAIESLSGLSMDNVKVHYNSDKPAQLQAQAYAQGNEIHLGAGQERHLPHEAWHVVQQAQGRVRPTLQMKAGAVNDDAALEDEADMMGEKAAQFKGDGVARNLVADEHDAGAFIQRVAGSRPNAAPAGPVVQRFFTKRNDDPAAEPHEAPILEVYAAQRRLRDAGVRTSAFRDRHLSPKDEGDLDDYIATLLPTETSVIVAADDPNMHNAIVSDALIEAYRKDLAAANQHYLQEAEGAIIANELGVEARVMNQVAGPLIQSNATTYGSGGTQGYLLHVNGNHYIVIAQVDSDTPDYVDMDGIGYVKVLETVIDGNCLIDGLHIIKHNQTVSAGEVIRLRALAAKTLGSEDITQVLTQMITDIAKGLQPSGLGPRTRSYLDRDPTLKRLALAARDARIPKAAERGRQPESGRPPSAESSPSPGKRGIGQRDKDGASRHKKARASLSLSHSSPVSSDESRPEEVVDTGEDRALENQVTRYVIECNRLGEAAMKQTELFDDVRALWRERTGKEVPDYQALAAWIARRETETHAYFGSDTESSDDDETSSGAKDESKVLDDGFSAKDEMRLARLNAAIKNAKTALDIQNILNDAEYKQFVVPQYRGIAYMTNRFGKEKRREHRKSSQLGKPVFADAVRPESMSRETFYTTEHGADSEVRKNATLFGNWLNQKRRPDPFVDPKRRVAKGKKTRVFPTPFHLIQSDYSENYSKSSDTIDRYHKLAKAKKERQGKAEEDPENVAMALEEDDEDRDELEHATSDDPARDKAYEGVPFRSHPFVSTADEPRHAVRYALGNKPIAAEKPFRLRPRWNRLGKPQHPYSGKVYASLHPLHDYLSPDAPSHVWSGRKTGALAINNDTSKEGESSFLSVLKPDRVAVEQVIRWASLVAEGDDLKKFGLSKEERASYRKTLAENPPHSKQQQDMKTKTLGPKVEDFFTALVAKRVRAEARRRGKKLIYRGLDGNFQSTPPQYSTPTNTATNNWAAREREDAKQSHFQKIKDGAIPYGGLTEGYFSDWPDEAFYGRLSDAEHAVALFETQAKQTVGELSVSLEHLASDRRLASRLAQACAAARKLASRARLILVAAARTAGITLDSATLDNLVPPGLSAVPPIAAHVDQASAQEWLVPLFEQLANQLNEIAGRYKRKPLQSGDDDDDATMK